MSLTFFIKAREADFVPLKYNYFLLLFLGHSHLIDTATPRGWYLLKNKQETYLFVLGRL